MKFVTKKQKITFYSIGENCLGHDVLTRHNVAVAATPFSHSRSNVDYLVQILRTDARELLDLKILRYEIKNMKKVVINPTYSCTPGLYEYSVSDQFEFSHHDVIGDTKARKSLARKTARFLNAFRGEGTACFVYHYRVNKGQDLEAVTSKLAEFKSLCLERARRPVLVCLFTQRLVGTEAERGVDFQKCNDIPLAILKTLKFWGGVDTEEFWGRTDDDLFGRMIGAFEYLASVEPSAAEPVRRQRTAGLDKPPLLIGRLLRRLAARFIAAP